MYGGFALLPQSLDNSQLNFRKSHTVKMCLLYMKDIMNVQSKRGYIVHPTKIDPSFLDNW